MRTLTFFILILLMGASPIAYSATLDPIDPDYNNTKPEYPEPEPIDFKKAYEDTTDKLESKVYDYEAVLGSNIITYYYYEDQGRPYPIELAISKVSHNPSYGEADPYLGQFVDSYDNNNSVNSTYLVIHNATLGIMELDPDNATRTEDFTEYIEVEEANEINIVNSTYVDCTINRAWTSYAYIDLGIGAIPDFKIYCLFRLDYHYTDAWGGYTFLSNNIGSEQDHRTNDWPFICWVVSGSFGKTQAVEHDATGTFYDSGGAVVVPDDTYYWVKFEKMGTTLEYDAYTTEALRNAEGNGDLYDGEITLQADYSFRYLYLCQSHDDNLVKEENLELYNVTWVDSFGGYSPGNYTTTDIANGYRPIAILFNSTIPGTTGIDVEFSNDTITWVNHQGASGYDSLAGGMEALDMRPLNWTTLYVRPYFDPGTHMNETPAMSQIRLVNIIGPVATGGQDNDRYLAVGILLMLFGIAIGEARRRN